MSEKTNEGPTGIDGFEMCSTCKAIVVDGQCNCKSPNEVAKEAKVDITRDINEVKADAQGPEEVQPDPAIPHFSAKDALRDIPGAPSEAQIEAWKADHGSVYAFPFDTKEIYVWRAIRRREYQVLKTNKALLEDEEKFQEHIVLRSVLWPVLDSVSLNLTRAGLVQTLYGVIMQGSYFLHPDFAVQLIEEL